MRDLKARAFDADAVLSALEPPVLLIGGQAYTGRVLSWAEMLPFTQRLEGLIDGQSTEQEYQTFAVDLFTAMELPAKLLLSMPIGVVWPAVYYFLSVSQASAPSGPDSPQAPPTPGSSSPPEGAVA